MERMGSGSALLAVHFPRDGGDFQLRTSHYGHCDNICVVVVVVHSC